VRVFRRVGVFLLALVAAVSVSGVAAPAAGQFSRVPMGVSVSGLPVGGFTSEETRELVREAVEAPVRFELGRRSWKATSSQLGVDAAVDDAVAAALHARVGAEVEVDAAAGRPELARYVDHLERTFARAPRNARLVGLDRKLRPVIAPEVAGRRLDRAATAGAIRAAVESTSREPVRPVFRAVQPRVTRRDVGPVVVIRRESKGLYLYEGPRFVRRLGVATGQAEYPTPIGWFSIVDKQYHPWWYPPDSDWAKGLKPVPPGPGNPLGTRWMGLSAWGVGIHGTPDAASIGYSASHGCIRMHISDAEWLFNHVRLGTPVLIVSA
jgi:lipoprotein-anchoring transpeptidase ErfK/SrfK